MFKKILLPGIFLVVAFSGCGFPHSVEVSDGNSVIVQPTITPTPQTEALAAPPGATNNEDSFECVRAVPEPIIRKEVYPETTFRLEKNREFPFQNLGYETVEFANGDKLLIEHLGCENFTLIFRFETGRFSGKSADARFWYHAAAELLAQTDKGTREQYKLKSELKALNSYIKKTKRLKFDEEIDYCGTDIKCVISLDEVKELKDNRVEIVVSTGIGPL